MQQPLPDQPNIPISASEDVNPEEIFNKVSWEKILEEEEEQDIDD